MLAICNLQREVSGTIQERSDLDVHHRFSKAETVTEDAHVQAIINTILHHENPFQTSTGNDSLHNSLMPQEIAEQLLNVIEIGISKYDIFQNE